MSVTPPPDVNQIMSELVASERLVKAVAAPAPSEYVHWDTLRHLTPPGDLTPSEWWWTVKWQRRQLQREWLLLDAEGRSFTYALPDDVLRPLHTIDQRCASEIAMDEVVSADDQARQHYLVTSLMEEAIRSSQLEGATTSRRVAKELLRTGREPLNRSERMIINNYQGLQFMRDIGPPLTPAVVLELQRILTEGTLDNPDAAGRLQRPDEERIAVYDRSTGDLLYKPPPAEQLPDRLIRLCEFANADSGAKFMHPVVKAILLHFWLAYDHPFEDGNGRTARALFYWSMRVQGYRLVEYLSISSILRKAPSKYARSYLLTETDDRDATYFLIDQLSVIERAIDQLHAYLRRKTKEVSEVEQAIRRSADFNHRQLALLSDAVRNPDHVYTLRSHSTSHNVTHETARRDLLYLQEQGLLQRRRSGRRYVFAPSPGLPELLKRTPG